MSASTTRTRVTRFSLPAERSASSILRKFVCEVACGTDLDRDEVQRLQLAVTDAFHDTVRGQTMPGEGRVALRIDASRDEIEVEMSYREVDFPPAEQLSLC